MHTSFVTRQPTVSRWSPVWLICLDLQREYVVPGRPHYQPANACVANACVRVLEHARAQGWRVVHSQLRNSGASFFGDGIFGAPIEGLRPMVTEPVFLRRSLSAFANTAFSAELASACGDDVYLMGFSMADTCLATAFAAVDLGLSLTLVEDAIGVGGTAAFGATQTASAVLAPFTRTVLSRDLIAQTVELAQ
jgi:nicotinamidase-related amidase